MHNQYFLNFPLILTLIRLIMAPFLMPVFLIYATPYLASWGTFLLASLFIFFSLTDLLDGYFARKFDQETNLGRLLDPIADKFLIFATSIGLLVINRMSFYIVLILNGREIFIMGLRLIACENGVSIPVSWYAKAKTACQFLYFTVVILQPILIKSLVWYSYYEFFIMSVTILITIGSAYSYYTNFIKQMQMKNYADNYID
jgi:CDP-diacylglycerol---glycerol-3-phosphate 3-phosphatidyltransferase